MPGFGCLREGPLIRFNELRDVGRELLQWPGYSRERKIVLAGGEMASFSIITGRQVTVPDEIFARLGLHDGDRVEFANEDGRVVMRPVKPLVDPIQEWVGALAMSEEEYNAWYRELRGRDPEHLGGAEIE